MEYNSQVKTTGMVCNKENWVSIEQFLQNLAKKKKKKAKNIVSQIKGSFGIRAFCLPQYFNLQLPRDRNPHMLTHSNTEIQCQRKPNNPFKSQVSLVKIDHHVTFHLCAEKSETALSW